jgi:uncharacterized protein (TIGR02266 family)
MASPASVSQVPRTSDRLPVDLPVEFRLRNGRFVEARMLNVSRGGMYVETNKILESGKRAFFRVQLKPQPLQFHLEGEVVWSRKNGNAKNGTQGMGIRFLISPTQTEKTLEGIFSVLNSSGSLSSSS